MTDSERNHWAQWAAWSLMAAVAGATFSIAVSGIFQAAALFCCAGDVWTRRKWIVRAPRFAWFLAAFVVAILVSLAFSSDPAYSLWYLPKPLKFLLVPLIFTYLARRHVIWTLTAILTLLTVSAIYGLLQFYWLLDINLLNRIRGFMSHWMTFSGQVMIALIVLTAWLLLQRQEGRSRTWPVLGWFSLAILTWALLLTYTRNAWLGAIAGVAVILTFFKWRWLVPAGLVLALLLFFFPAQVQDRLLSSFDLTDETVRGRIELAETGARMIAANPLTGVGPMMVPFVADQYRGNGDFPRELYLHLHNSPLQIAAELGLPALLIWLSLWAYLMVDLYRRSRRHRRGSWEYWFPVSGICLLSGFLVSGLLEFNYGDAELAILLLFFLTAPYVVERDAAAAA